MTCNIFWHKLDSAAIIPTKRNEDAGFDIYTTDTDVWMQPHEKYMFKTGIQYSIDEGYFLLAFDRGSTGSKGIHVHCGICDQGYRGELFICLNNDNDYPVFFSQTDEPGIHFDLKGDIDYLVYPTTRAIAQLIPLKMPEVDSCEVNDEIWEILKLNSERGEGKLGASGK